METMSKLEQELIQRLATLSKCKMVVEESETMTKLRDELADCKKSRNASRECVSAIHDLISDTPLVIYDELVKQVNELKQRAERAESGLAYADLRASEAEKRANAFSVANAEQAICINNAAGAIGPDTPATIERLPLAVAALKKERDDLRAKVKELEQPDAKPVGYVNEKFPNEEYTTGCIVSEQVEGYTIPVYLHPPQQPGEVLFEGVRWVTEMGVSLLGKDTCSYTVAAKPYGSCIVPVHVTIRKAGE